MFWKQEKSQQLQQGPDGAKKDGESVKVTWASKAD